MSVISSWIIVICAFGAGVTATRRFKSVPTTVKTYENDTVQLPCDVEDFGEDTKVIWWRDNVLLADSDDPTVSGSPSVKMWENRTLQVFNVQLEDSGEYVCQASRPGRGGFVTQVHEIEVMYPPSIHPVPESGELEVALGMEVDMSCIAKGIPTPIISWRTKGEVLQLRDDRARLRFHADNRSLAGQYTCIANNGVGEPASATIDLKITYKPEIETRNNWVHASPGIRAQLDCKVTAWPEAKVEWYFADEKIEYSSRIVKFVSLDTHSLIIRNVRASDYGYYICRAANSLGISEIVIELSGVASPAVLKKESRSISKTAYNFIWEVDSYSKIIEYQFWFRPYKKGAQEDWRKLLIPSGSDAIGPVHARSFNLTGLEEATHYEALILSRNRFGWSRPSKVLRFATECAPTEEKEEELKTEITPDIKVVTVVRKAAPQTLASSGSFRMEMQTSTIVLSIFYILICGFSLG